MDRRRAALEMALKVGKEAKLNPAKKARLLSGLEAEYPATKYPQAHELFEQACTGAELSTVIIRRSAAENRQLITALAVSLFWLLGWLITKLLLIPDEYFIPLLVGLGFGGAAALFHGIQSNSLERFFR